MEKLRIGIPTNDRMFQDTLDFFQTNGLTIKRNGRAYLGTCEEAPYIEPVFIRYDDIAVFVARGDLQFGITTNAIVQEKQCVIETIAPLGFSKCKLVLAANESVTTISDLNNKTIATSFTHMTKDFCQKNDIDCDILHVSGSCEAYPAMGTAAAIVDITQTGSSLRENKLTILETLIDIEAILTSHCENAYHPKTKEFLAALHF